MSPGETDFEDADQRISERSVVLWLSMVINCPMCVIEGLNILEDVIGCVLSCVGQWETQT